MGCNQGEKLFKSAFESTALGMSIALLNMNFIAVNKAYCEILGYSKEELLNMTHWDLVYPDDKDMDKESANSLAEGKIMSFGSTKRYICKDGKVIWGHANISIIKDEVGAPKYFVAQLQDFTELIKFQHELRAAKDQAELIASRDFLTNCLSRREFIRQLDIEIKRAERKNRPLSLIVVDIDRFKIVNDSFGHLVGDHVLVRFSAEIKRCCRSYDIVGRFGGEEFIICLPDTAVDEAKMIAERFRENIENLKVPHEGKYISITGSFGVAMLRKGESIDRLINRADNAMYRAKIKRNSVSVAMGTF